MVTGTVINGVVSGETVSFDLDAPGFHHTGSVSGSTMSGQFTLQLSTGGTATGSWTANKGGTIPPPLGKRENPARTNQTIGITATNSIWGDGVLHITLLAPIIRGQEALNLVKGWNQFNDDPPPGFEYLLARFRVRVITAGPEGIDINHARFDAVSADGVLYSDFVSVAGLTPNLSTTIFAGGAHEGLTPFIVRIGDQPYFLFDEGRPWATWFRP